MAEAYHARPSAILGVGDPFAAFCVDRAVLTLVQAIQNDQEVAVGRLPKNAKQATQDMVRQRVLDSYLGIDPAKVKGRFRDPGSTGRKRG